MTLEEAIALFSTAPEKVDDANLIETALRHPVLCSEVAPTFLARLNSEQPDSVLVLIDQAFAHFSDFRGLIWMQSYFEPICRALIKVIPTLYDAKTFEKMWFFLLQLLRVSITTGTEMLCQQCRQIVEDPQTAKPLRTLLQLLFESDLSSIASAKPRADFRSLDRHGSPVQTCVEFLLLLNKATDVRQVPANLAELPYLWPSALFWAINSKSDQCEIIYKVKPPNYKVINDMFRDASVCINETESPWLTLIRKPNIQMLRRFPPPLISDIYFPITRDLAVLARIAAMDPHRAGKIVVVWRAWLSIYGVEAFVTALLKILIWNVQVCNDKLIITAVNYFRYSACCVLSACDGNADMIKEVVRAAMSVVRDESVGGLLDGEGLAEFCLIMTVALTDEWHDVMKELCECREALVKEEIRNASVKLGFCRHLIKCMLTMDGFRRLIGPEVFGKQMTKHMWRSAIEYFLFPSEE
jgi:hypothetical protein